MKDAYYFPHDANAREDEKILKLIKTATWFGYGLYWAIVERLHEAGGWLEDDPETIAFGLRTEAEKIRQIVHDFELFAFNDGKFSSKRVLGNIQTRKSKSKKGRDNAMQRWKCDRNATAMPLQCDPNARKERKGKEIKGKKNTSPQAAEGEPETDLTSQKEKPPHVQFCDRFKSLYESMTGLPYKHKREHFILAAHLIKTYGFEMVVQKVNILGRFCKDRAIWFTKGGWADFSIEKLSGHWNAIIPEAKFDKQDEQEEAKLKRRKLNELTDHLLNS